MNVNDRILSKDRKFWNMKLFLLLVLVFMRKSMREICICCCNYVVVENFVKKYAAAAGTTSDDELLNRLPRLLGQCLHRHRVEHLGLQRRRHLGNRAYRLACHRVVHHQLPDTSW